MRWYVYASVLLAGSLSLAQDQRRTYVYDWEGRRSNAVIPMNDGKPVSERVQEKIVRDSGGVRIVERLIQRFDPDGRPLPPEKVVVEQTTRPDGSRAVTTTNYQADLNGHMALVARRSDETRPEGADASTTDSVIQRADVNGSLATIEKRKTLESKSGDSSRREETRLRPDGNGGFVDAFREVEQTVKENGAEVRRVDQYESASTGALQLSGQTVTRTTRDAAGVETAVTDVYGPAAPGRPMEAGRLALRERQVVETTRVPGGSVETLSIQRPSLNSSHTLGPPRKVSETVCTGQCGKQEAARVSGGPGTSTSPDQKP
jgi:hypothetical protein